MDNLIGKTGGETVHWLTNILVIGLILYIDAVQFIRFLQNMSNRNSSDMQAKAIARDNIKSCIMIIVVVTVIGAGGYVALGFFMNMIMTKAGIM
ncbi:hypothetical protein FACS189459_6920 [Bacilli bacterium]|nr:hypothetical protein FACS189459_6920 [Bacilli bacterium]GHU52188.1 hypothetical protein FACS189496_1890 [Bacilli bacterium]